MFTLKGFLIPCDAGKFFKAFFYIMRWNRKVRKTGFNNIIKTLEKSNVTESCKSSDIEMLIKYHRLFGFILTKLLKHSNPCTIISLSLFEICKKRNIQCMLVVGADKKNNEIFGHSWIEVDKMPVNENLKSINKYTRVIEV